MKIPFHYFQSFFYSAARAASWRRARAPRRPCSRPRGWRGSRGSRARSTRGRAEASKSPSRSPGSASSRIMRALSSLRVRRCP